MKIYDLMQSFLFGIYSLFIILYIETNMIMDKNQV